MYFRNIERSWDQKLAHWEAAHIDPPEDGDKKENTYDYNYEDNSQDY